MDKQTQYTIIKTVVLEKMSYDIHNLTTEEKKMLTYLANQINNLEYKEEDKLDLIAEPKFLIINKDSEETEETCETLKEAIEMLDYDKQYIFNTETNGKVQHIQY